MPKGNDAYSAGMKDAEKIVENSKKAIDRLDSSIVSLGDTLDYVANKMRLINQTTTNTSKGIAKVTKTLEYYDKTIKSTFKIQTKSNRFGEDIVSRVIETPDKPKPKVRSLVGYKGVKESAELTSSETKKLADGSKQLVEVFKKVDETGTTTYKAINKKIIDVKKSQEETTKKTSKFGILLNQIKRIAVYRAIRRGLQIITQTFTKSLTNLAQFDESVNKNVSTITSAFTKMRNSVAVALYPLLNSLTPIIDSISNSLVGFANQLSLANAQLTGQSTYLKVNEDYWKDYANSVKQANKQLLSFDKFEVLQQGNKDNVADMFTKEATLTISENTEEANKTLQTIKAISDILSGTVEVIKTIIDLVQPIIEPLLELIRVNLPLIADTIKLISPILTPILEALVYTIKFVSSTLRVILSLLTGDFKGALQGLEDMGKSFVNSFLAGIEFIVNAIVGIINTIIKPINWIGRLFGAGENFAQIGSVSIPRLENGGIPDKSELFYMNEYGKPEAMMNLGGQTNVINQDQLRFSMKEGFKEAFVELGLLEMLSDQRIVLEGRDIDNSAVARGLFNALKTESKRRGGNQL